MGYTMPCAMATKPILCSFPLWRALTTSDTSPRWPLMLSMVCFPNHVIIFVRANPRRVILYFILSGHVKISVSSAEPPDDVTLALLGPGAFFGEMSLLDDLPLLLAHSHHPGRDGAPRAVMKA